MSLVVGATYVEMVLRDFYTQNINSIELVRVSFTKQVRPDGGFSWILSIHDKDMVDSKKCFYLRVFEGQNESYNTNNFISLLRYNADGSLTVQEELSLTDYYGQNRSYPLATENESIGSLGQSRFVRNSNFEGINIDQPA